MATLYEGKMAEIYDVMYQNFINYDEEYEFYHSFLKKYKCKNVLEIGSGTGNLAHRFHKINFDYLGLDYSQDMIEIAQKRNPEVNFLHGDMRDFALKSKFDSILITGRTTSYIISNLDLNNTLKSIYTNLNEKGILCFDFIDANKYIPFTLQNQLIIHEAKTNLGHFYREGNWQLAQMENFMLHWTAKYYLVDSKNNTKQLLATDNSTVRVFTLNEIQLFLEINNFEIIETINRITYAYDTYVIVARKK